MKIARLAALAAMGTAGLVGSAALAHAQTATFSNPSFSRRIDLADQGLASVQFCVTTSLFAWAPSTSGSATVSVGASSVVAELPPLP